MKTKNINFSERNILDLNNVYLLYKFNTNKVKSSKIDLRRIMKAVWKRCTTYLWIKKKIDVHIY